MAKLIIGIVLGALLGGFGSKFFVQRYEEEHRHARSVMTLLGFHQDRLDNAAKAGNCADFGTEHTQLVALQREISLAFPKAYAQEAGFKKSADKLGTVLQAPEAADAAPGTCPSAATQSQHVSDACDECHKVYDPH
jgi:hypothetical protein